jgi:hypothetical protein
LNAKVNRKGEERREALIMQTAEGGAFDPETIELLRNILEEAWGLNGQRNKPNRAGA